MRLSKEHQHIIRQSVVRYDADAEVILFGSRVNDALRGGDIDLLIRSDRLNKQDLWPIRRDILDAIGWQKLDLILERKTGDLRPISCVALKTGVSL